MAGQEAVIGALGILIFSGIIGRIFVRKTGIPDVFLLLLAGACAGALLPAPTMEESKELLLPLGSIALLMIMLEEGLSLKLSELFSGAHKAFFIGSLSFLLSLLCAYLIGSVILGLTAQQSLLLGAVFSSVAPEILAGFLMAARASASQVNIARVEGAFTEPLSVMLALLLISGQGGLAFSSPSDAAYSLAAIALYSIALGGAFAFFWKVGISKLEHENEHIAVIGLAALLYALCGRLGGNGVVSVFAFGFLIGNSPGVNTDEVRRFQAEMSFFMRTFFFVYLGALLFHSPAQLMVAFAALALSLCFAASRLTAGRALSAFEQSLRTDRALFIVSGRGLTAAVLAVVAYGELAHAGAPFPLDLPLLALFVIFFSNLISAYMALAKRKAAPRY
jgi:cell volume regulation protein A